MNDAGASPEEQATEIALLGQKMETLGEKIDTLTESLGTHMKITSGLQIYQAESSTRWKLHDETHRGLRREGRIENLVASALAGVFGFMGGQQ